MPAGLDRISARPPARLVRAFFLNTTENSWLDYLIDAALIMWLLVGGSYYRVDDVEKDGHQLHKRAWRIAPATGPRIFLPLLIKILIGLLQLHRSIH